MAGFQLTLYGRIWATPEGAEAGLDDANQLARLNARGPSQPRHIPNELVIIYPVFAWPMVKKCKLKTGLELSVTFWWLVRIRPVHRQNHDQLLNQIPCERACNIVEKVKSVILGVLA
jgi:hypothetical protein